MNKLEIFKNILDFLPELFPPDLSAITLSNCEEFVGIWGRNGNTLGQSLKTFIYPGKKLIPEVMLGQVIMQKKKITKYYTEEESISGIPYLAVGVPIYEDTQMIGGICAVREETILETVERCKNLLEVQEALAQSMMTVSTNLTHLVNSYREVRRISDFIQSVSQKVNIINVNTSLEAEKKEKEEILNSILKNIEQLSLETKGVAQNIVTLLNDFDKQNLKLFSSIRNIETIVNNMSYSVNDIMEYLSKQSHMIMKGKS
ncbi:MAG TPA: hypothetical protein GX532_03645 [Clostridia bacterium]|jgi:hypothetical protein|nr:hypothetical protein [Clostridia bacterium]HHY06057.1 hypothetical protein [Clostridia bacterium]